MWYNRKREVEVTRLLEFHNGDTDNAYGVLYYGTLPSTMHYLISKTALLDDAIEMIANIYAKLWLSYVRNQTSLVDLQTELYDHIKYQTLRYYMRKDLPEDFHNGLQERFQKFIDEHEKNPVDLSVINIKDHVLSLYKRANPEYKETYEGYSYSMSFRKLLNRSVMKELATES